MRTALHDVEDSPAKTARFPYSAGHRAAAACLAALIALAFAAPALAAPSLLNPFPASAISAWAQPAVDFLAAQGIVRGATPEDFAGQDLVTQEQAVTMIGRTIGWSSAWPAHPSPQVDAFAQPYVARAQALGIDVTFPRAPTSRLQAAEWIVAALKLPSASIPNPFRDLPGSMAPPVLSAVQAGIVDGVTASQFDPLGELTREEFAVMLFRAELAASAGGAIAVGQGKYLARSGLTYVQAGSGNWAMLAGSAGVASIGDQTIPFTLAPGATSLTIAAQLPSGAKSDAYTVAGGSVGGPAGVQLWLPQGVPPAAGALILWLLGVS